MNTKTDKIVKGVKNPKSAVRHLTRQSKKIVTKPARYYFHNQYGSGVNALTEDWDNLIILDACRYDTFAELHSLPGNLSHRFSVASATLEWLENAVGDREFHDIVYVTANPRVNRYEGQFHEIVPAWKTDWDDELKVVPPDTLADLTIDAFRRHPDKRIVTHFMQPHIPFIGKFGRSQVGIYDGTTKGVNRAAGREYTDNIEPYVLLEDGDLDKRTVKKAYRENLELVFPAVEQLLEALDGKSVVTADHGEMFGDVAWPTPFRVYGHRLRTPAKELLEVPWLEYTSGERRKTTKERPESPSESIDDIEIEQRLKYLGYR
jgi:hypothetical protein